MKSRLLLPFLLLCTAPAWAAAPVEERQLNTSPVENAQQKADYAWKRMSDADQQVRSAEQDLAEAERQDQQARQRAEEAAKKLEQTRKQLADAQARKKAAKENWERTSRGVGQVWGGKPSVK